MPFSIWAIMKKFILFAFDYACIITVNYVQNMNPL